MGKIKNLFATPKRTALTVLILLIIVGAIGSGGVLVAGAVAESSAIGSENAKNFAFADAGVDPLAAQSVRSHFDYEHGQFVYEVEFIADGIEYEYWIKASDGAVLKKETDILFADGLLGAVNIQPSDSQNETSAQPSDSQNETSTQPSDSQSPLPESGAGSTDPAATFDLAAAKKAALADAGVNEADAVFTKEKKELDHGVFVFDIEFKTATHHYEYEIDASTGSIRSRESEALPQQNSTGSSKAPSQQSGGSDNAGQSAASGDIGLDSAKKIAVGHAGLTVSDVTFSKAKLEHDDGYLVYEIEFYRGDMEYDYTINARTGDILDYNSERDNQDWDDPDWDDHDEDDHDEDDHDEDDHDWDD